MGVPEREDKNQEIENSPREIINENHLNDSDVVIQ